MVDLFFFSNKSERNFIFGNNDSSPLPLPAESLRRRSTIKFKQQVSHDTDKDLEPVQEHFKFLATIDFSGWQIKKKSQITSPNPLHVTFPQE